MESEINLIQKTSKKKLIRQVCCVQIVLLISEDRGFVFVVFKKMLFIYLRDRKLYNLVNALNFQTFPRDLSHFFLIKLDFP